MDIFERLEYKNNIKAYNTRITKTKLSVQEGLSKAERELLKDKVEDIRLEYVFNKNTYPMERFISDNEWYDAIYIVKVILSVATSIRKLSKIIQIAIQSPTIIIFEMNGEYLFSSALKRLNKAEKGKTVAEEFHFGKWINLCSTSNSDNRFLDTIMYGSLPSLDFKQAYITIHQAIYKQANADIAADILTDDFEEYKIKVERRKENQQKIDKLVRLLNNKSTSLKDKVEIVANIEQLKKSMV